ncbi:hypothetical protein KR100_09880 [Synechococcus sp. KORDI-100]|uniref:recombinase family protein n=1 Tax=Synechococcus sp. KORDI-100 TaxID=1280380 RepID=UPI0004E06CCF|nr:recombinase family protein [Synechococcus sp. KORDI-100]AII43669.1 hypothetical protein KR100_09880 [Synechococcus sp. KORDI-100]
MKVGYLRISDKGQTDNVTVDVQRAALLKAGAEKVFEDLGVSAYKENVERPGFEELIEWVERGQVSVLIVNSLDRLSRSEWNTARINRSLRQVGAKILNLQVGCEEEPGELGQDLFAAVARDESRRKSRRIKQTYQSFKDAGLSHSARAPWAIRIPTRASIRRGDDPADSEERVPIRDETHYPKARALVEHYLSNGCTHAELFRFCQAEEIPLHSASSCRKWLTHPMVVRLILHAGEPAQIAKVAARHAHGWKRPTAAPVESHPLRGLVFCDRCGRQMASANQRSALKCARQTCPNTKQVRGELISWAISAALAKATETATRRLLDATQGRQATSKEIELQSQQQALEKAIKSAPALEATLRPQIDGLARQLAALQSTDLTQWQTLAQDWLKGHGTWSWYQIPGKLKPRIYRALVRSVHCDEGRPLRVVLADGTVGETPNDWPEITNAGVTYGIEVFPNGKTRRAPLRDEGPDLLGWHRLLLTGQALEDFAEVNHDKWQEHHDAERRRRAAQELSEEEMARIIERGPPEGGFVTAELEL